MYLLKEEGMRIVLIGTDAKSSLNFRRTLIQKMIDQGHDVFLIANGCSFSVDGFTLLESPLTRGCINPFTTVFEVISLCRLLKSLKPDCVFSFFVKPVILGTLAAKCAKVKNRVGMIEGLGAFFTNRPEPDSFKTKSVRFVLKCLYKVAIPFLTRLIVLNRYDLNEILAFCCPKKTSILGGIGVPLRSFPNTPPALEPVTFLFIGRLLFDKGIREFIHAATLLKQKYPAVIFKIVGDIDPDNPTSLTLIEKEAASHILDVKGFVEDIKSEIIKASVVVLPSYREGVPMSLQEAMGIGRPIIATYVPGCRETIRKNGYFVEPFDAIDLAKKMERLILNPKKRELMGVLSAKRARKLYNRDKKDDLLLEWVCEG